MDKKTEKINVTKAEKTTSLPCKNTQKKSSSTDEFKRKYFEFYDDIKISDRQDW